MCIGGAGELQYQSMLLRTLSNYYLLEIAL